MKRSELFFGAVLVPIDFISLALAGVLAYYLRVSPAVQQFRPALFTLELPFREYFGLAVVVALVIQVIFALMGLYALRSHRRIVDEVTRIISGVSLGVMLIVLYIFLAAELFQSRFILVAAYGLALVLVTFSRMLVRRMQSLLLRRGYGAYRVVVVGNGQYGVLLADLIQRKPQLGYRLVEHIEQPRWDVLEKLQQRYGLDELIQADPSLPMEDNLMLLDFCDQYKLDYRYVPNLFETQATNVRFHQMNGVPLVELARTPLDGWGRIAKRSMDIIVGVGGLLLLSPLLLLLTLLIKLDSRGPVLYRQVRIGRHKNQFEIMKFRSMQLDYCLGERYGGKTAEELDRQLRERTNERRGPLFKMRNDPRLTRVGRYLRRWRLDEFPQLFNVLRGDMSLVGPRPHLPKEVARYTKHHRKLFEVKPGMSGMAQVHGSSSLNFDEEVKLDLGYIENWSLKLDIILLLKTLRVLLTDKSAV